MEKVAKIISELYQDKDINKVINTLPNNFKEDVKQNAFLIICKMNDNFVLDLHSRGKLKGYTYKVIINEFKAVVAKYNTSVGIENIEVKNEDYEEININFEKLEWYEAEILKLREKHTLRAIEKITKISHNTINSIINNISKKIINAKDKYTTTTKI